MAPSAQMCRGRAAAPSIAAVASCPGSGPGSGRGSGPSSGPGSNWALKAHRLYRSSLSQSQDRSVSVAFLPVCRRFSL